MAQHFLLSAQRPGRSQSRGRSSPAARMRPTRRSASFAGPRRTASRFARTAARWITTRPPGKRSHAATAASSTASPVGTIFASPQDVLHRPARRDLHRHERGQGLSRLQLSATWTASTRPLSCSLTKSAKRWRRKSKRETPDGHVEIDGAYFGGHVRPANRIEDRVDRRLAEHQTGKRRVVVALRERGGRTFTHVTKQEAEGVDIAFKTRRARDDVSMPTKRATGTRCTRAGRSAGSITASPIAI